MSVMKDKKVIDAYMKKHAKNLNPVKLEEYAKSKGIHINAMKEIEHIELQNRLCEDLGLPKNLDMSRKENQVRVHEAIENLSPEKRNEYIQKAK